MKYIRILPTALSLGFFAHTARGDLASEYQQQVHPQISVEITRIPGCDGLKAGICLAILEDAKISPTEVLEAEIADNVWIYFRLRSGKIVRFVYNSPG